MKRGLLGIGLLLALLAIALWAGFFLHGQLSEVCHSFALARDSAIAQDWEAAQAAWADACRGWSRQEVLLHALADESFLEQIDQSLSQGHVLLRLRERSDFAATAAQLEQQVAAVARAHK